MTLATRYFDRLPAREQELFKRLAKQRLDPKAPLLPEGILDHFAQLVEECRGVYRYGLDDFTNDLTVREILQDILDNPETTDLTSLRSRIAELDDRFRSVTTELPKPVFASDRANTEPSKFSFYYRIPRQPGDEMIGDLLRMKIIHNRSEIANGRN